MHIIKAHKKDKKALLRFYKSQQYSASFMGFDHAYFIKQSDEIIASVIISAILPNSKQTLLHGLVVAPNAQRNGVAKALVEQCYIHHHPLVCFADNSLEHFYTKLNFNVIEVAVLSQYLAPHLVARYTNYLKQKPQLKAFIRC